MSDERNESYRRLGQHNTNKSKPSGWKDTALSQGLWRTFFFSLFKTQRLAVRNEIANIATLLTNLRQLTCNVKLHANFEILPVVEEAYTVGIDLHDLRLFDDIPLMSHHAVDKGEAL